MSFASAFGMVCLRLVAQVPTGNENSLPENPELRALLAALPQWSTSATIGASYGYKDNLLLSSSAEEQSAFARGSVELLLLRVPYGRFEYFFSAKAESTEYFSAETANHDAKVYLQTEPGFRVSDSWMLSLPLTGFYYDQVFDVSDTEVERRIAELKVRGAKASPTVRWDFHPAAWVEAQAAGQARRYEDGGNDGDLGEGFVRLGWAYGGWLEARLSGGKRWRSFRRRSQYNAAGRALLGTRLKIAERETEARFDVTWDEAARWQTTTRASLLHYRDNGSGYFNYRESKVAQEAEWHRGKWLVRLAGSASRIDFAVQTVGFGIRPPFRIKDEFTAQVFAERELSRSWTILGQYSWERSRSNEPIASYTVNEGLLGLRWSWRN